MENYFIAWKNKTSGRKGRSIALFTLTDAKSMCELMNKNHPDYKYWPEERVDPRDPDYSREGLFIYHNCWKCEHGKLPCVVDSPRNCKNLHARND